MKISSKSLSAALLLSLVLVLVFALPGQRDEVSGPDPAHPTGNPFGIYSPGSLAEVSQSGCATMINVLGLETLEDYENFSVDLVGELGVGWARLDFLFDGWHFIEPVYVDSLQGRGIEVAGTIRPLNNRLSSDPARFENDLRGLIRRYPQIRVWQIGNEPNDSWRPDDYVRFFFSAQVVIRQECPECRIALAGIASGVPTKKEAVAYYNTILDLVINDPRSGGQPFDIFDAHYYSTAGQSSDMEQILMNLLNLLNQKGLADIELWFSETSTYTGSPVIPVSMPAQTEQQQASELVQRFVAMLGAGVDRIAWSRPYENYRYHDIEGGFYDYNGLVYNGLGAEQALGVAAGTRKEAYYAYQTLISTLEGYTGAEKLAPGQYRFDFDGGRPPVYVIWDAGAAGLPGSLPATVTVTAIDGAQTETGSKDLVAGPVPTFIEAAAPQD